MKQPGNISQPEPVAIDILAGMLTSMTVHKEHMAASTEKDFSNATELADYLASKGLPFRQAHEIVDRKSVV